MSERFTKKWENRNEGERFLDIIRTTVRPTQSLKPRLDITIRKIDMQINKLEQTNERFSQKDKTLFTKLVDAYGQHDMAHANIIVNELAEIRKMSKLIMNAKLALDQVSLRIKTLTELGDVITTLDPCIEVIRCISAGMRCVLPEAENELGDIENMLSGLMLEAGSNYRMTLTFNNVTADASKILIEAAIVSEQKMNALLPDFTPRLANSTSSTK